MVRLVETFEEGNEILMILDLLQGDLTSRRVGLQDLPRILKDILLGLRQLHHLGFVHFDIRPGKSDQRTSSSARTPAKGAPSIQVGLLVPAIDP